MKNSLRKILSVVLSVMMIVSVAVIGASAVYTDCGGDCEYTPTIIIPGVFQCEYYYYENGEKAKNSAGEYYEAPFLLESTADIVIDALFEATLPLVSTLVTQEDPDGELAQTLADVITRNVAGKIKSDAQGKFVNDLRVIRFESSIAKCTEEEKAYIYNQIPLGDFAGTIGEDHLYFFTYNSFGNMIQTVDELYDYIQKVKEETGHDKVNLVPISQGGSIANGLIAFHPEVKEDINRMIFTVPALNGSSIIGEIFEFGLIDDADQLYNVMFPRLIDDNDGLTGYVVNLALRILPNDVVNNILDVAVDSLINDGIKNSTLMWGLCPCENYPGAAEKYLSGEENAEIRRQTDLYYQAQLDRYDNILSFIDAGVKVFDVVDYNYPMYPLVDSWDDVNADGIIQLDSESMGATSFGVDVKLPDDYVPAVNNCTDPEHHDHSDPFGIVDPLTGLLPEHTFYYINQDHEKTARNDALVKLIAALATDENFVDVHTYPDKFPQFNQARNSKGLAEDIARMKAYDKSGLSDEDAAALDAAIAEAEAQLNTTAVDTAAFDAAKDNLYATWDRIVNGKTDDKAPSFADNLLKILSKILKFFSDLMLKFFGGKGFSEIFK